MLLSRYFHANNDGSPRNLWAKTVDSIMSWNDTTGHGLSLGLVDPTFKMAHTTMVEKFVNWNGGTKQSCFGTPETTPRGPEDDVGRMNFNLATLKAGASKSVTLRYGRL
jgi:hypothetical protein